MQVTAKQLADQLKELGFEVASYSEPDFGEDGAVILTDAVHVQVGFDYAKVVKQQGDGVDSAFLFFPDASTIEALAKDLREAL